jgi:hypothetical protein
LAQAIQFGGQERTPRSGFPMMKESAAETRQVNTVYSSTMKIYGEVIYPKITALEVFMMQRTT